MNPKTKKIITLVVMIIAGLMIGAGGVSQLLGLGNIDRDMTKVGAGDYCKMIGAAKIVFVAMYFYPKTFKLGFLLLSCILAGAIATLLTHGEPLYAPVVPLVVLWIATYLRDNNIFLAAKS